MLSNQQFCYWLQGYFEITNKPELTKEKIIIINARLKAIHEPLGEFTQWLVDVVLYFAENQYRQPLLTFFLQEIMDRLNLIFYHVIDNSYDTNISREEGKKIHDGHII